MNSWSCASRARMPLTFHVAIFIAGADASYVDGDDGLDDVRIRRDLRKPLRCLRKPEAPGNPRRGVDSAGLDEGDDLAEIVRPCIAAREQRELATMKVWIVERHGALEEPDEHDAAALCREIECARHRRCVAGGVDHDGWQLTAS